MGTTQTRTETDAAAEAWAELNSALADIEQNWVGQPGGEISGEERAARRYLVANSLQHAFDAWFEADPVRPMFYRWLSPTKKLLGDNPDAVYYGTVTDPAGTYRIRGNISGAVYTSFTVEAGAHDGKLSQGLVTTLNDSQIEIEPDGSYEIIASAEPQPKNWLRLAPEAGSITTRHYWEHERSPQLNPNLHVPLSIEPLHNPGPARPMDEAAIAAGVRRVVNFVRGATIDFPEIPDELMPDWVSRTVNQFSGPDPAKTNEAIGYAAKDIDYRQTIYELGPDEALVMRGRFPRCRFANVVIWNHRLQTPPYRYRKVSLNRRQVRYEPDGSFRIVLAHSDPGTPNWLDAAGISTGMIFWRFLLPEEEVVPIETELVNVRSLRG